jgi:hypothetical protein
MQSTWSLEKLAFEKYFIKNYNTVGFQKQSLIWQNLKVVVLDLSIYTWQVFSSEKKKKSSQTINDDIL